MPASYRRSARDCAEIQDCDNPQASIYPGEALGVVSWEAPRAVDQITQDALGNAMKNARARLRISLARIDNAIELTGGDGRCSDVAGRSVAMQRREDGL